MFSILYTIFYVYFIQNVFDLFFDSKLCCIIVINTRDSLGKAFSVVFEICKLDCSLVMKFIFYQHWLQFSLSAITFFVSWALRIKSFIQLYVTVLLCIKGTQNKLGNNFLKTFLTRNKFKNNKYYDKNIIIPSQQKYNLV